MTDGWTDDWSDDWSDDRSDDVVRDLAALGREAGLTVSTRDVVTAVMERVSVLPDPVQETSAPRWPERLRDVRARIAVAIAAVLVLLLAVPPVRATVADWFGFGGIVVERGVPTTSATDLIPPEVTAPNRLSDLAADVAYPLYAPTSLGEPQGAEVSADGRMVSISWSSDGHGTVRLDQFDAAPDYTAAKTTPRVRFVAVGDATGLWFPVAHDVVLLEPDGDRRTESARSAGPTLVWQEGSTTLRLEGDLSLREATAIADSTVPLA